MLTPEYYNYCADEVIELYSRLDETITRDIARRIMKTGYVTDGAKWLINVEREAGLLYDEIIEKVAEHAGASEEAVRAVFNEAGLTSKAFDDEIYESAGLTPVPLKSSLAMLQVLTAGIAKTNSHLYNLTKTTALTSQTRFIEACSLAEFEITSGAFDYNTAIRHAVEHAVEQGTMVEYASGAKRSLESAVRTAVMTGVSQTTGEISLANARELGTDLMEISAHGGARPSHAEWQGQIVSISGDSRDYLTLSDIGYGTIEGFKGINCRHDWWPFIEGISTRAYTDEELKEYRDETVEYNGKEMSVYDASQRQRAMERQIRQERCQLAGLDEAIKNASDKELKDSLQGEFDHLALKMKGHEAKYSDFSKQTGLPAQRDRLQTKGFNRSVSLKAYNSRKIADERLTRAAYYNMEQTKVAPSLFENEKWKSNFESIIDNSAAVRSIRRVSEQMLKHRDGTLYEDMYLIDAATGKIVGFNTTCRLRQGVICNESLKQALEMTNVELIGVHNHPRSSVPSLSDLNALVGRDSQVMGVVVCHDGTIFTYTTPSEVISQQNYDYCLTKYKDYSMITRDDKGMQLLSEMYGFSYRRYDP